MRLILLNQQRTDRFMKEQRSHINLGRVVLITLQRRDCQIKRKNFMEVSMRHRTANT